MQEPTGPQDHINVLNLSEPVEVSNLATALSKAQGQMSGAKKDKKNDFLKSTYADLASVFDAIREPFSKMGLSVSQVMDILPDGKTVIITKLMHTSGEFLDSKMILPIDVNPQKLGSYITYYRKYSLMSICGIPAADDDGNAASGKTVPKADYISSKQVSDLERLINGNTAVREQVLANCNGSLETITVERYPGAVSWVADLINKGKNDD